MQSTYGVKTMREIAAQRKVQKSKLFYADYLPLFVSGLVALGEFLVIAGIFALVIVYLIAFA